MEDIPFAYVTAAVIVAYFLALVVTKKFDPFAPTWLFLVGYMQVYVVQAIHYHDWGVSVRGKGLVAAADWRALWALVWFLAVYHLAPSRRIAGLLPRPPRAWSALLIAVMAPPLVAWGLFCAGMLIRSGGTSAEVPSAESTIFSNFPFVMMVAAILLIVTGRTIRAPRPAFLAAGLVVAAGYVLIWMFNGKRSHSLIGVLATICALYITRLKRPSWPALVATAFAGALVVTIAIGWRNDRDHERSIAGFGGFLADFDIARILQNLNVADAGEEFVTYESEEYGGFLLMMDTVPEKSGFDYGENYLRVFSTFIPRVLWPSKPVYGRAAWINAWIEGSEMKRDEDFTGPAISLLGATQLNGGAVATAIVVGFMALVFRSGYEYFRAHADVPWVQFLWAITYYNAWFTVVNDDPMVWFYYTWGFSVFPIAVITWWSNKFDRSGGSEATAPAAAWAP